MLQRVNIPFFKIGSCDADNFFLLERVASYGKPMIVSTGKLPTFSSLLRAILL